MASRIKTPAIGFSYFDLKSFSRSYRMPNDLGGESAALEMLRNGFGRICCGHALPLPSRFVPIGKAALPKIAKYRKNVDSALCGRNPLTPVRFF